MKESKYYDIIIIGAGIAGLYSAYLIKQMSPKSSVLVLEKDKLSMLGGRAHNVNF
jgi:flavin-dependent dehydrogenase